ncbi:neutral/alkaline non-lysosomal ceramidase N-terminal domain-containing protein [Paenibacillus cymbidii]|uniref:neutral/alkaline non-lysosomal ceramidase N-terminal domain-containing protein n=1 Tax=Paenibacillus cymbidii TaxID=1639034 RepID=UPI001080F7D0|nr:neutral/alkaline non-lysosomal ceramidase N-terminal domain-containing protein [Paenibacillus cymbidii]
MKFSMSTANITPDEPVFMNGFGARTHASVGVLDPLYMKAALMVAGEALLLVTIDALGSDRSFTVGIKDALQARFGLTHAQVMINFSHTHHSVFLTGTDVSLRRGGYSMGQSGWMDDERAIDYTRDEAYFVFVRDQLLRMVETCFAGLEEGELQVGRSSSDFAVSRRRPVGGGRVAWQPYPEAEIDRDLFVLRLIDRAGNTKGILFNYGCHTTAMGASNYLLSGDFAGFAAARLEQACPGATAMYLQGCAGELKPLHSAEKDRFVPCDPEQTKRAGEYLADDVLTLLRQGLFAPALGKFQSQLHDPFLYTERTPAAVYERLAANPELGAFHRAAARRLLQSIANGTARERLPYYIGVWRLGEETTIVALEGEVSTQYSLLIKRLFGNGRLIVLGYTNGVFCYVPTRSILEEGGYEAESNYFFDLRGPFVPEIEDIITGRLAQALLLPPEGV